MFIVSHTASRLRILQVMGPVEFLVASFVYTKESWGSRAEEANERCSSTTFVRCVFGVDNS